MPKILHSPRTVTRNASCLICQALLHTVIPSPSKESFYETAGEATVSASQKMLHSGRTILRNASSRIIRKQQHDHVTCNSFEYNIAYHNHPKKNSFGTTVDAAAAAESASRRVGALLNSLLKEALQLHLSCSNRGTP